MKRIKKLLFIVMIIGVCSGCTINYEIEIKESHVFENIMVNDTYMNERSSTDILYDYNTWIPIYNDVDDSSLAANDSDVGTKVDGIEYHEKTITKINNGYYHTYKYTYPINRFSHANSLKLAFGNPSVYDGGSYINIRTNSENGLCNYEYFESMQVNIKVDLNTYTVSNNNAYKVSGNTYTWNLNRNNCNKSIISMTLNKKNSTVVSTTAMTVKNDVSKKDTGGIGNYILYIFLGIIVLVIIFGYRWFNKMKERENGVDD